MKIVFDEFEIEIRPKSNENNRGFFSQLMEFVNSDRGAAVLESLMSLLEAKQYDISDSAPQGPANAAVQADNIFLEHLSGGYGHIPISEEWWLAFSETFPEEAKSLQIPALQSTTSVEWGQKILGDTFPHTEEMGQRWEQMFQIFHDIETESHKI